MAKDPLPSKLKFLSKTGIQLSRTRPLRSRSRHARSPRPPHRLEGRVDAQSPKCDRVIQQRNYCPDSCRQLTDYGHSQP
jgi:hypothetical protein